MAFSQAEKLFSSTIDSRDLSNFLDVGLVDLVNYEVDLSFKPPPALAIVNNHDDFRFKPKIDLDLIERENLMPFTVTNFSRPLTIAIKLHHGAEQLPGIVYLLLYPGAPKELKNLHQFNESVWNDGAYSAVIVFKDLHLTASGTTHLNRNQTWRRDREMVHIGPINHDAGLKVNFKYKDTSEPKRVFSWTPVSILLNPKLSLHQKMVFMLEEYGNKKELSDLEWFVKTELKNPGARFSNQNIHQYQTISTKKNVQTVIHTSSVEFHISEYYYFDENPGVMFWNRTRNTRNFSNETLQFIESFCRAPLNHLNINQTRIDLVDSKDIAFFLENKMSSLKWFWKGSTCPVKIGMALWEPVWDSVEKIGVKLSFSNRIPEEGERVWDYCVESLTWEK